MILTGKAAIYGVKGQITLYGIAFTGDLNFQTATFTGNFTKVDLLNQEGDVAGAKVSNRIGSAVIDMIPIGSTNHNTTAAASTTIQEPEPLALVRLFNFQSPQINGYWNYAGGISIRYDKANYAVLSLPLIRYSYLDARYLARVIKRA